MERLDALYDSIFDRSRAALLSGGVGDAWLTRPEADTRMALALVLRPDEAVRRRVEACLMGFRAAEPGLYAYPAADLHLTVLDILRGEPGRRLPAEIDAHIACVRECAKQIAPFAIRFDGLTASENALMARGYPEDGLEAFRALLRRALAERGIPAEERYETHSAHMTIARIRDRLRDPEAFVRAVERRHPFGETRVTRLELVFHDWYDARKRVLCAVVLGGDGEAEA